MKKLSHILTMILICVFVVFFSSLVFLQKDNLNFIKFKNDRLEESLVVYDITGKKVRRYLPINEKNLVGRSFMVSKFLTERYENYETLAFFAFAKKVDAYLDGEKIYSYGHDGNFEPYEHSVGSRYFFINLPKDTKGKRLNIEIFPEQKLYMGKLNEILLGTTATIKLEIFMRHNLSFVFAGILFILGVISVLINIWAKKKFRAGTLTYYLGLISVLASIWIMTENPLFTLYTQNQAIKNSLTFLALMSIPIVVLKYIEMLSIFKKTKAIRIFIITYQINAIVVFVLQILNIVYFTHSVVAFHIISAVFFVYAFFKILFYLKSKDKIKGLLIIITTFIFLAGAIYTIIILYLNSEVEFQFVLAATILLILMVFFDNLRYIFKSIKVSERDKFYEIMATRDFATGAYSRNAYLREIDDLQSMSIEDIGIFLVDLDNLKYINDKLSHILGDSFIKNIYEILNLEFDDKVYRIGGDEFVIFVKNTNTEYFDEKIKSLQKRIKEKGKSLNYPFAASAGFSIWKITERQKYEEALYLADLSMYEFKKKNKLDLSKKNL